MAERNTCAIRDDGMLFCWGDQAWGQGGLAADGTREGLVQVGNDTDWRTIAGDADIGRDLLRYQDLGSALVLGQQPLGSAWARRRLYPIQ